ncbi:ras guanine nucleotide exchange factor domain-containing protein [Mucor lusitanicus]|uniref:Ras guanine nucleotide exchange factor domain-containing protein n=1 Tax=Mucor circinelloides f. lusitanicus TaxID=29924 RepID=A0A8H4EYK4_MUCCL|nr:ras guanine nucleotide exchange factor domain-containing protein [Mucor lusitanicus]
MEDPQSSLNLAFEHYENGQIKDAYNAFLATAQNAMKPLFDVKFVHCSIVSKPQNSAALLSALHSCLDHIEKIMEYHSPTASASKIAPPLPPKPSHVSKPVLPPKPSPTTTTTRATPPIPPSTNAMMMKRTLSAEAADNHTKQSPPQQHTRSNSYQLDSTHQRSSEPVPDGEINACHLVPAQTNNSDSLTPPNSSSSVGGIKSDHIPLIPIPPLLTTHTVLQEKLDELELALKDFRAQKNQLSGDTLQDKEQETRLNDAIAKYTPYVAEAKHTLNRVRTLYMCAATIPSILHFQPGLVAYQLTRIESAIFLAIPPQALLSHAPKTPHPRVVASSDFFNYVTRMIEHSVLLPQEASVRAQHINQWIKVASKCQDLNNYQTLKGIISALWTPPVQRLKRTWAYIPKKSLSRLESMTELMSEANNYGKYREHMGIVSTSVLNGKSVNLIQSEHYKRPTVPFLGTFIHDMTYLLAAVGQAQQQQHTKSGLPQIPIRTSSRLCKADSNSSSAQLHKDPRINKLLEILQKFQSSPPYDRKPSAANAKMINTKQQVRPALSQAIHRSKSSFGRLGGAIGFGSGSTDNNSTSDLVNNQNGIYNTDCADDFDAEEQQSLVTQYLLMRPWVSQNTVDELSLLREPPSSSSTANNNNKYASGRTNSMGSHYTSSIMSNTSSLMRLSNPATNSTLTLASSLNDSYYSRPASLDDAYYHQSRSYVYGRGSSNVGPLTSSSTLEDNDDGEFDEENGATTSHHHVVISPRDGKFWNDPAIALYNKGKRIHWF